MLRPLALLILLAGPLTAAASPADNINNSYPHPAAPPGSASPNGTSSPPAADDDSVKHWKILCRTAGPGCARVRAPAERSAEYEAAGGIIWVRTACKAVRNRRRPEADGLRLLEAIPCPPGEMCRFRVGKAGKEGRFTECVPAEEVMGAAE